MRWLLISALCLGVLAAAGSQLHGSRDSDPTAAASTTLADTELAQALQSDCPQETLPDNGVCIPAPRNATGLDSLQLQQSKHRNRLGTWSSYEQIPRRPDRPASYSRYRFPLDHVAHDDIVSGYDLHVDDEYQRRGPQLHAVGHGGVDIVALRGTPVKMINLEAQQGDATVVYVGELFGNTVVTRHRILEAGSTKDYLAIFGHLDRTAPNLVPGGALGTGQLVGLVGDSGSPGAIHLHLELRQVRTGIDPDALGAHELAHNARTVACDPRNLLPLRQQNE